ncbi:MAG TPA: hypothetical protein VMV19_21435 [Xanthobacteraceae bacterium]|nr:hypothetical protein [Xanthobacteraceae bacterium]
MLFAAWAVLGLGMALGLYDAGFAALAPLLFGLMLDRMGAAVIFVSAGLCVAAFAALLWLRASHADQSADVI